jgi:hypothetical protein
MTWMVNRGTTGRTIPVLKHQVKSQHWSFLALMGTGFLIRTRSRLVQPEENLSQRLDATNFYIMDNSNGIVGL